MKVIVTDPIADLLTRLRNAEMAGHDSCVIPYSKIKESILGILKKHEYLKEVKVEGQGVEKCLHVTLNADHMTHNYKRISTPGQRIYRAVSDIKSVQNGLGIAIYSTSRGIFDNIQARKNKIGGELLCEVW